MKIPSAQIPHSLLIALTALMPITIMSSQGLPSALFYAAVLASLIVLASQRLAGAGAGAGAGTGAGIEAGIRVGAGAGAGAGAASRSHAGLLACMAAPLIAVLWSAAVHRHLVGLDLEVALRFFLGFWVLWLAYRAVAAQWLRLGFWGFVAATGLAVAYILVFAPVEETGRPQTSAIYNAVGYGSLTALLMTLCVLALRMPLAPRSGPANPWGIRLLLGLLALAALVAVVATQTRTAWMAIPVFVLIAGALFIPPQKPVRLLAVALLGIVVLGALLASNSTVQERAAEAYHEATTCTGEQNTANTSICIRFQLWRASLDMLAKRPWAGTGSKRHFNDYLVAESLPQGLVSAHVAENWGEPHNDLLLYLTSFGWPGGLALLLVYLGPAWVFGRRLLGADQPPAHRAAAAMGLAVCLGFLIFGLTETLFRSMRTVSFYTLCVAYFMALSEGAPPAAARPKYAS
ncbi:O-antigen ligase family protein [Castellaniella sp.]|uniref:O-antigen ligase family protein n=1 Tax=Castellaniella sp. TaxID=1955812 RepID=UPI00355CBE9E